MCATKSKQRILRVGIIGQGRSGRNIHAEYLKTATDKFKIVAVCDLLKDRCERAQKEYGCKTYQDYREMINDKSLKLDFVVNSTFSHLHAPISKDIMLAGLNVLSEKPFGKTADDIRELIGVSKRTGRLLAVFQQGDQLADIVVFIAHDGLERIGIGRNAESGGFPDYWLYSKGNKIKDIHRCAKLLRSKPWTGCLWSTCAD